MRLTIGRLIPVGDVGFYGLDAYAGLYHRDSGPGTPFT